ncbi:polysaccharide deacetylase family protein [Bittarella massiliensis (ex Durand et al. 2017)]|uniref:polysaccharide deacetylase family protein n=1 Tax=Bittarella massiliensis (ex Durand et al. 2017) TaxID=1720313 RepID=UPI00073EB779|nr:polysaccharide deacetylase [Bittarella massiliensis (ex Durand et al. 2017)]
MYTETMTWPQGKRCAALITVNLDAEYFWLQLDPAAKEMPKTLSMGQYGMLRGVDRLLDVLARYQIKATFFCPGKVAEEYPDKLRQIAAAGHEIGCHGYEHENLSLFSAQEQRRRLARAVAAIEAVSGRPCRGFRAPEGDLTLETLAIAKELGMVYSSDLFDDDRPYYLPLARPGEEILEIPMQWANFDFPYLAFNYRPAFPFGQGRVSNYTNMLSNWKDEFLGHYNHGLCYVMQLDPQTIGNPGRTAVLEEFFDYATAMEGVWFATGSELHAYCEEALKQ